MLLQANLTDGPLPPNTFDVETLVGRRASKRWQRTCVGDIFERLRWSYPDKEAVVGASGAFSEPRFQRLTYQQADDIANQFANALLAEGLAPGDRCLFVCENSVEALVAKIGAAKAGVVCAPLNPRVAADVQRHLVGLLAPRFVVVDAELWPVVSPLIEAFGLKGTVIPIGESGSVTGWPRFQDLIANLPSSEPSVEVHGDDIWQILPTSGTTSMPKCVMQSHTSAYLSAYGFALTHSRGSRCELDLRLCTLLPVIYHAADQVHVFPAFLCGGTAIIGRKAGAVDVARAVRDERVTALFVGSSEFLRLVVEEVISQPTAYTFASLKSILFTWAALSSRTEQNIRELCGERLQLVEILGQTESLASTRFWPDRSPAARTGAEAQANRVGLPSPLLAAQLIDDTGAVVARSHVGKPGEIVYRSPAITAGYYLDEAATREAFRDGWFHSGDCCAYDAEGELVLIDRFKDVVKSGGENVSTPRVEAVLSAHPDVVAAAVVGLPHARWSEAVTAFVVIRQGAAVHEDVLVAHCRDRLAGYETPKRIVQVTALPVSVGTKVRKHVLRAQYAALYSDEKDR